MFLVCINDAVELTHLTSFSLYIRYTGEQCKWDSKENYGTPNSSSPSPPARKTTTREPRMGNSGVASGRISGGPPLTLNNQSEVLPKVVCGAWYGNERIYRYLDDCSTSTEASNMGKASSGSNPGVGSGGIHCTWYGKRYTYIQLDTARGRQQEDSNPFKNS